MFISKLKLGTAVLLVAALLWAGTGLLPEQVPAGAPPAAAPPQEQTKRKPDATKLEPRISSEERDRLTDSKARIIFAHSPPGDFDTPRLASICLDEKNETHLSKLYSSDLEPQDGYRISPDGKKIVYRLNKRAENTAIYAIHVRGLDPAGDPIDLEVDGQYACWSPDGSQIAVSSGRVGNVIVDVATKKQTEIKLPERHWIIDWARDGTWFLVLCGAEKEKWSLARVKKGETEIIPLPDAEGDVKSARISPDSNRVLYACRKTRLVDHLWVVDLESGKARQLTEETNGSIWGFGWSPSGKRIAYNWRRFDPDSPTDPFEQEIEFFLMVIDSDGKNPTILRSETGSGISSVHFCFWDWR